MWPFLLELAVFAPLMWSHSEFASVDFYVFISSRINEGVLVLLGCDDFINPGLWSAHAKVDEGLGTFVEYIAGLLFRDVSDAV
jgi:hypothetical protein